MARLSEAQIEHAYKLFLSGANYRVISRILKCDLSKASCLVTCFCCATKQEVIDIWVHNKFRSTSYSIQKIKQIVEDMYQSDLALWQGVMLYKIEFNKLQDLLALRKKKGRKLTCHDIKKGCPWTQELKNYLKPKSQQEPEPEQPPEPKPKRVRVPKLRMVAVAPRLREMKMDDSDEYFETPRIFGRAKAMPRHFYPKNQRPRQQEEVEATESASAESTTATSTAETAALSQSATPKAKKARPKPRPKVAKSSQVFYGHPASKYLDSEGNYILKGKPGRAPMIDPESEGFEQIPCEVRLSSLQRGVQCLELEIAFYQMVKELYGKKHPAPESTPVAAETKADETPSAGDSTTEDVETASTADYGDAF